MGLPRRATPAGLAAGDLGAEVAELAGDVAHLVRLLGLDPVTGEFPDGVIIPSIDHRSQIVIRLRAWLADCARPLTVDELRGTPRSRRGLTAAELATSYNRWAREQGYGPMSAGVLGRWLTDDGINGRRCGVSGNRHRYAIALRDRAAAPALALTVGGGR
jgi:hypothetical protein